ncbi:sodium:proton antiporter [Pseudoalteromonas ruthenica]|uniref:Sodium:proton antiporter n=1 Tax=Pseudoalteromonas ruthenica TaxID=151081 RepID=A0A5S3Z032_9GAMM|nr:MULTISPECIES: Na+/H+ antiporter NhaC family protein [Pseudoalteromonas]MCF2863956.1 Na+/H+ antiporter NhaC family protein [Pseudoalteromonas sp. CNAT2-18]MCG7558623.1 Na+/H+ antiporter NhaC family protein [Pseudoalteromonas sp. CNAT2-18.1]MCG7565356.1 Na+/H+ antiporter NhaC family protein [Pseudoalteromonas sp. CnMc7-15]MCG7568344.1 Na+/H+ antiporter NhaC family protein [Pseudoalteromonas sp. CNC9-20]RZF78792.1 Na+/H+ antiporter NhaC family protein [Pseudoalteromonas sp. CO325X]|tara:strand:+ start:6860 stop:8173 length:1314 start_codon:yes stop_codon:yes gene_type:complete
MQPTYNATTAKLSLLPLLIFVALFLGTGLYLQSQGVDYAFYQLPAPVAILPAIVIAFLITKQSINASVETFIRGAGHSNIITMCLIYLLAGAFSAVAGATGGVDAVVNAGLSFIPASMLLPGLFLIAAIVSTAMGTSMGTIGAIGPIALAVSAKTGIDPALMAGTIVSGAMFGDNLSIISDTTIAATRTQGCEMKDKFRENLKIALPAAILTITLLVMLTPPPQQVEVAEFDWLLVLPYFFILVLAVMGLNVFVVLFSGIIFAAIMGFTGDYQGGAFVKDVYQGFSDMQEIFLLSMFIGGLSEFIRRGGGLDYLANKIQALTKIIARFNRKVADQIGIALLVMTSNLCIANNTVSIIVAGPVAKKLADDGDIAAKRSASLLDIFACVLQGSLPYGAQALLLGATFSISPWQVSTSAYYCFILAVTAIITIILRRHRG